MLSSLILSTTLLAASANRKSDGAFHSTVQTHIKEMVAQGYVQSLSWDDLNHGHIFLQKEKEGCYTSLDEALDNVKLILYHSAEHNYRWKNDGEPPESKIPRSVVGLMDGKIMPAINFIGKENLDDKLRYEVYGTIGINEIIRKVPDLYHGNLKKDNTCVRINNENWSLSFEFHIDKEGNIIFGRE